MIFSKMSLEKVLFDQVTFDEMDFLKWLLFLRL